MGTKLKPDSSTKKIDIACMEITGVTGELQLASCKSNGYLYFIFQKSCAVGPIHTDVKSGSCGFRKVTSTDNVKYFK